MVNIQKYRQAAAHGFAPVFGTSRRKSVRRCRIEAVEDGNKCRAFGSGLPKITENDKLKHLWIKKSGFYTAFTRLP